MTDDRTHRIGQNEHLFRTVNEKIESLNATFGALSGEFTVVCECGDAGCVQQFTMTAPDYTKLRDDPTLFAIAPGHEAADVESVVEKTAEYWVIRKHPGAPADLAKKLDEQSG